MSLAGICLYWRPGCCCEFGWQVTFSTQLAPTLVGSMASRPLPSNKNGNTGDAGCVSMSAMIRRRERIRTLTFEKREQRNDYRIFGLYTRKNWLFYVALPWAIISIALKLFRFFKRVCYTFTAFYVDIRFSRQCLAFINFESIRSKRNTKIRMMDRIIALFDLESVRRSSMSHLSNMAADSRWHPNVNNQFHCCLLFKHCFGVSILRGRATSTTRPTS